MELTRFANHCIVEAVKIYDKIPGMKIMDIYAEVGKMFGKIPSQVERVIRYAIEHGLDRCWPSDIENYFGNTISYKNGKPTNREFIARLAYLYSQEM